MAEFTLRTKNIYAVYEKREPAPVDPAERFVYGTAGFRYNARKMGFIVARVGVTLVDYCRNNEFVAPYGVMITASHNPGIDNGLKLVGPLGGPVPRELIDLMVTNVNRTDDDFTNYMQYVRTLRGPKVRFQKPESLVLTDLLKKLTVDGDLDFNNSDSVNSILELLKHYAHDGQRYIDANRRKYCFLIGFDTRSHSSYFHYILTKIFDAFDISYIHFPHITTPQHHLLTMFPPEDVPAGDDLCQEYGNYIASYLRNWKESVVIDCANGVGTCCLKTTLATIHKDSGLTLANTNIRDLDKLNVKCGADYVKSKRVLPELDSVAEENIFVASLDGDADRLVFSYYTATEPKLMDGENCAHLFTEYIYARLRAIGIECSLCTVYTSYSNSAFVNWLKVLAEKAKADNSGVKVHAVKTATGVANLIHAAVQYDIAVYFEPNGHGSVIFSRHIVDMLAKHVHLPAAQELIKFLSIINPAIGDGVSNLIAVLHVLIQKYETPRFMEWTKDSIDPYYSVLDKVKVRDRSEFISSKDDEAKLMQPAAIQPALDAELEKHRKEGHVCAGFLRASGTEDIVRLYADGSDKEVVDGVIKFMKDLLVKYS